MKKRQITNLIVIVFLAIFVGAGCQSSQSSTAEQKIESETVPQSPQQKETDSTSKEDSKQVKAVDASQAPKIVMTKDVHDFGKVGPGTSHKADYEFKNEGQSALLVNRIQSTCGCSKPTLIKDGKRFTMPLKEPVSFEPGELGKIEVTFKSPSRKGKVEKSLYVLSDDPASERTKFSVKAYSSEKVRLL